MAKIGFHYNSDEIEDEKPYGEKVLFPAGDYIGVCIDSDVKETKSKSGRFIYLKWQIVDGVKKGSIYEDRLNVENQTIAAEKMSRASMKSLQKALKLKDEQMHETSNYHNIPVKMVVRQYESKSSGKMENGVSYAPVDGSSSALAALPAQLGPVPTSGKKPWEK